MSQLQNLIGSVKSTADKASGLSRGLYAAAHQILGQADQQSSMAASTNASMQRMAQSIDAVSSAVDRVGAAADHASKIAKSGHTSVRSGAESSQQIVLSVDSSSRSIGELS
ncbi:hypothetical protein JZU56_05730, partial [bacterium]|nr:hypothetical protein [bacterium]